MRRRTRVVGLVLLLGGGTAAILLARTLRYGFSAKDEPPGLETAIARAMRRYAAPADLQGRKNPLRLTPAVLEEGKAHFADHCAICHANDGSGDTPIGQALYPKAPDMRERATQALTDGELFYIIRNGVRFTGMPGWGTGPEQEDHQSWGLVHLVRHLPRLTPEELAEMKRLNPKGPHELAEEREAEEFLRGDDAAAEPPGGRHNH